MVAERCLYVDWIEVSIERTMPTSLGIWKGPPSINSDPGQFPSIIGQVLERYGPQPSQAHRPQIEDD
jgi:hypothetical protein